MVDVPKLQDAHWAGTNRSSQCTLVLTEGDSAMALAVAGFEVVGREVSQTLFHQFFYSERHDFAYFNLFPLPLPTWFEPALSTHFIPIFFSALPCQSFYSPLPFRIIASHRITNFLNCLSVCLSVRLSVCPSVYLSACLSVT